MLYQGLQPTAIAAMDVAQHQPLSPHPERMQHPAGDRPTPPWKPLEVRQQRRPDYWQSPAVLHFLNHLIPKVCNRQLIAKETHTAVHLR
jgi:hypothetical protein